MVPGHVDVGRPDRRRRMTRVYIPKAGLSLHELYYQKVRYILALLWKRKNMYIPLAMFRDNAGYVMNDGMLSKTAISALNP